MNRCPDRDGICITDESAGVPCNDLVGGAADIVDAVLQ